MGLANGLDALWIAFRVLGIKEGDEVIVQANTYIASVMGITINGANPVFIEPNEFYNLDDQYLEKYITSKTKAILVVHLYGQATKMDRIVEICKRHQLKLVEDCAQSHGASFNHQQTGSFGDIGCFSFYPSKNLGCFGDGGAITTNDSNLAQQIKVFRNYGSDKRYHNQVVGTNSRLDELQAGLLRVKLMHMDELEKEREDIALQYLSKIDNPWIELPFIDNLCKHVWHLFVIRSAYRDELLEYLKNRDILALIHYPIPPHLSEAYQYLNYHMNDFPITETYANQVLSLPLYNGMTQEEIVEVILKINKFEPGKIL